ncbi:11678_t:CDS:2 [Scutellospora calospora]|uniref:11678_t:CDS:1 n=1 Tax=Scutellospora calospora TaxID=85575 RepID=A0ACA9JUX3_9GLOM|nr:11678_t:CDS:2 [Scutellospora calospora]
MSSLNSLPDFEKFIEISPNFYRATFGLTFCFTKYPVAIFLVHIHPSNDWVLIDAADSDNVSKVLQALSNHFSSFPNHKIKYIALTHGHHDHTSAIPALLEKYNDAMIVTGELEVPFLVGENQYKRQQSDNIWFQAFKFLAKDDSIIISREKIIAIQQGKEDEFEFSKILKPIFTVGHTAGSLSYQHVPTKSIIVGDMIFNVSPRFFLMAISSASLVDNYKSIEKISQMKDIDYIYPGHNMETKGINVEDLKAFLK